MVTANGGSNLVVKRQKNSPGNISSAEKAFDFEKARYEQITGMLTDQKFINLLPGGISHAGTDEVTYADLLLQDSASDDDEKRMVQLDAQIKIKENRLKSMQLQIARQISPTVTQAQLEKTKPMPFPLAQSVVVSTQTEWCTIVVSWTKLPGNLNACCFQSIQALAALLHVARHHTSPDLTLLKERSAR